MRHDDLERLHHEIERRLGKIENEIIRALAREYEATETDLLALLAQAEAGDQAALQRLLQQVDQLLARLGYATALVVAGLAEPSVAIGQGFAQRVASVGVTWNLEPKAAVEFLQQYHLGLIRRVNDELRARIREELTRGFLQGESIPQIARRLVKGASVQSITPFQRAEQRAEVIARTETIRAFNQGALAQYRAAGVQRVIWLTARDERVCPVCGPLQGRVFRIDKVPWGGPPAHPQCRCAVRSHETDDEVAAARANRNADENWRDWQRFMTHVQAKK